MVSIWVRFHLLIASVAMWLIVISPRSLVIANGRLEGRQQLRLLVSLLHLLFRGLPKLFERQCLLFELSRIVKRISYVTTITYHKFSLPISHNCLQHPIRPLWFSHLSHIHQLAWVKSNTAHSEYMLSTHYAFAADRWCSMCSFEPLRICVSAWQVADQFRPLLIFHQNGLSKGTCCQNKSNAQIQTRWTKVFPVSNMCNHVS